MQHILLLSDTAIEVRDNGLDEAQLFLFPANPEYLPYYSFLGAQKGQGMHLEQQNKDLLD